MRLHMDCHVCRKRDRARSSDIIQTNGMVNSRCRHNQQ
jgi:hypothetical protein